jgi:hypothetical protein
VWAKGDYWLMVNRNSGIGAVIGWGCSSVEESFISMCKALSSIPSTANNNNNNNKDLLKKKQRIVGI